MKVPRADLRVAIQLIDTKINPYNRVSGGSVIKNLPTSVGDIGLIPVWEDPLEKGMATHSSTVVWEIPWIEELGRLQSMGLQKSQTQLNG